MHADDAAWHWRDEALIAAALLLRRGERIDEGEGPARARGEHDEDRTGLDHRCAPPHTVERNRRPVPDHLERAPGELQAEAAVWSGVGAHAMRMFAMAQHEVLV